MRRATDTITNKTDNETISERTKSYTHLAAAQKQPDLKLIDPENIKAYIDELVIIRNSFYSQFDSFEGFTLPSLLKTIQVYYSGGDGIVECLKNDLTPFIFTLRALLERFSDSLTALADETETYREVRE